MKNGKAPTVKQRRMIQAFGLEPVPGPDELGKPSEWLVFKDTAVQMEVFNVKTGKTVKIPKDG